MTHSDVTFSKFSWFHYKVDSSHESGLILSQSTRAIKANDDYYCPLVAFFSCSIVRNGSTRRSLAGFDGTRWRSVWEQHFQVVRRNPPNTHWFHINIYPLYFNSTIADTIIINDQPSSLSNFSNLDKTKTWRSFLLFFSLLLQWLLAVAVVQEFTRRERESWS